MKDKRGIVVKVEQEISMEQIENLLCSALEGGSNYWCVVSKYVAPRNFKNSSEDMAKYKHISYPINVGGALHIEDNEDGKEKGVLNIIAIKKGLALMAKEQPKHFAEIVNENDDADTADVFLQLCVFGKLIFG